MEEWVDDRTRHFLAFIRFKGELAASLADDAKYKGHLKDYLNRLEQDGVIEHVKRKWLRTARYQLTALGNRLLDRS